MSTTKCSEKHQCRHKGSIPFTRFYFACWEIKASRRSPATAGRRRTFFSAAETAATTTSRLAAEEFLEGLEKFVLDVASFFPEVVQFLRELHLFAAVDFAARRRNFVRGKIEFVGGAGGFTTGGREMI